MNSPSRSQPNSDSLLTLEQSAELDAVLIASLKARIQELEDALRNMMGAFDNPVVRRRMPADNFIKECINSGRAALQPKDGAK
jgi:hypothetical protein